MIDSLISGLFIAIAIAIGFSVFGLILCYKALSSKKEDDYDYTQLKEAFEKYLEDRHGDESYEEIPTLEYIIEKLNSNSIPELMHIKYNIVTKKEVKIQTGKNEEMTLSIIKKYQIKRK